MQGGYGQAAARSTLRFLTCGSVDDGKSTLIGRLLYEQKLIYDDQLAALRKDSLKHGTDGSNIDYALLVDGLEAEREQGITIDVAYRYFATERRSFIVADTPGHEQYTRNMATGASNADLAVLLVDARKGLLQQTLRHATIASLLGIRHVVLAVNKIDLVDHDEVVFRRIVAEFERFSEKLAFLSLMSVPISARHGDNISTTSPNTPWYSGTTLLDHLETIGTEDQGAGRPFRLAVQWVNRPNLDFRGFSGSVSAGQLRRGDVVATSRGQSSVVTRIVTADGDLDTCEAGDAVTLVLADEIDISRGEVLSHTQSRPQLADQFAAHVIWMAEERLLAGRSYLMKLGTRTVPASVTEIKHRLDINSFDKLAAKTLALNEVGFCNLATTSPVAFDAYGDNRDTGGFILIDRATNATVAAGMIAFGLRRATNIHHQALSVGKTERAALKNQQPIILWLTGLSGAGKSTIANLVEQALHRRGAHTVLLDGDNVRHGLNKDLGFTDADRVENLRRVAEVARLMVEAGLIVLCSFISPFARDRAIIRERLGDMHFLEIFVDAPLELCARRDPKGLYAKAHRGELRNFTGVDSPYEPPHAPDLILDSGTYEAEALADLLLELMLDRGIVT